MAKRLFFKFVVAESGLFTFCSGDFSKALTSNILDFQLAASILSIVEVVLFLQVYVETSSCSALLFIAAPVSSSEVFFYFRWTSFEACRAEY